jgi:hypothetical protein
MSVILALVTTIALIDGAAAAAPTDRCDVPESFLSSESELTNVTNEVKAHQRLDISVIGTGSSSLAGVDGVRFAYPARLEEALQQQLKGMTVKVTAHVQPRASTAEMVPGAGENPGRRQAVAGDLADRHHRRHQWRRGRGLPHQPR